VWLAKGQRLGYKHRVAKWVEGGETKTHWWLVSPEGCVLDPTAAQFPKAKLEHIYTLGRGAGPQGVRHEGERTVARPGSPEARLLKAAKLRSTARPGG